MMKVIAAACEALHQACISNFIGQFQMPGQMSVALEEEERRGLLERALAAAARWSLGLPAAERSRFIGEHLLAQHDGRSPPVPRTCEPPASLPEELRGLSELLKTVVNEAMSRPGSPVRNAAQVLLSLCDDDQATASAPFQSRLRGRSGQS